MNNRCIKSSGNVHSDLGYADAEGMAIKARLAMKIDEIIAARGWTQQQAAGSDERRATLAVYLAVHALFRVAQSAQKNRRLRAVL